MKQAGKGPKNLSGKRPQGGKEGKWKKRRKKRRKKKKTKCKESTRTGWWSEIRKSFVSAFTRKRKEVEVKRGTPRRDKAWHDGEEASSPFAAGTKHVWCERC